MSAGRALVVVVPVRGKGDILAESLESLATSVARCSRATLVLVDNNPLGEVGASLYRFSDRAK